MQKILVKNATVVMPSRIIRKDILIEDKFIAKIDNDISDSSAKVIDAHELIAMPGAIDAHVHFREPGMEHKATIETESKAAVLGGVTSFMDMPNTNPPTINNEALLDKLQRGAKSSLANYAFHIGATPNNIEDIKKIDVKKVPSVKVYMGSTTGNLLLDNQSVLEKMFEASPIIVTAHCEDNAIIAAKEKLAKEQYGDNIPFTCHPMIRNRDCCMESAKVAINAALSTKKKLHIMHLSTRDEVNFLNMFKDGNVKDRQISAEACIPHLMFSAQDFVSKKGFLKCNPSVKQEFDRLALIDGINKGIITTVGTDHAPHELSAKETVYTKCASGLPSVQFMLLALFELYKRGDISIEAIARLTASNVAKRFDVKGRGELIEGNFADIALISPNHNTIVTKDLIASKCKWSVFEGHTFHSKVVHTIVSGTHVVEDGKIVSDDKGLALEFDR